MHFKFNSLVGFIRSFISSRQSTINQRHGNSIENLTDEVYSETRYGLIEISPKSWSRHAEYHSDDRIREIE